jgi:hypothetical protein
MVNGRSVDRDAVNGFLRSPSATLRPASRLLSASSPEPTMQRTPSASRSVLILTSGIISAVLSATLFCLAYLVL